jgi:hypothetical protein
LTHDQQTEAYCRGESAAVFGWAIQLFETPDRSDSIDPGLLASSLRILHPSADQLLRNASLRPEAEIHEYCFQCLEIRHQFQLQAQPRELQEILQEIHRKRMAELGLTDALDRSQAVVAEAENFASTATDSRGMYVVRALAAEWLLGGE